MDYSQIISALKNEGHTVDEAGFSDKMTDPKFVESVRTALSNAGHNVSDSATFANKYQAPTDKGYDYGTSNPTDQRQKASDLYNKVLENGYTGLSPEDKDLFNQQAKYSRVGQTRTLYQVQDLADKQAAQRKLDQRSLPAKAYQGVREVLAENVGGPLASWFNRPNSPVVDENGKTINPGQTYLESVAEALPKEIEAGKKDEGLSGFLSDPTNIVPYIGLGGKIAKAAVPIGKFVGLGTAIEGAGSGISKGIGFAKDVAQGLPYVDEATTALKAGSKLKPVVKTMEWLKDSPIITQGLKSAATDATLGAVSSLDPLTDRSALNQALLGGALGGVQGALGSSMREEALGKGFVGEDRLDKAAMKDKKGVDLERLTRDEKKKVYDAISFPYRRKDYYDVGRDLTNTSSKAYKKADEVFDEAMIKSGGLQGTINIPTLEEAMRSGIEAGSTFRKKYDPELIDEYLNSQLKSIKYNAGLRPTPIEDEYAKQILTSPEEIKMLEGKNRIRISDLGEILGSLNTDIAGLVEKNPTAKANMAMDAKHGIKEIILGSKEVPKTSDEIISQIKRGGIVDKDFGRPVSYNEVLEKIQPGTEQNYKLGKKLLNTVKRTNETGQATRVGHDGLAVYIKPPTNYVTPALQYKMGDKLARSLWRSATERDIINQMTKEKSDNKKKKP